jgi:hypothetical protein
MRTALALLLGLAVGALGWRWLAAREPGMPPGPLMVMTQQVHTRAVLREDRQLVVWYRACPEVPGPNPEILVIWPGRLGYEIDLAAAELTLRGDVLAVRTPPVAIDEPAVPSDLGDYVARSSIWTLANEQATVADEMRRASPLARHLAAWLLVNDPTVEQRMREELASYLRGVAGALGVPVARVEVEIARAKRSVPPRPAIELCPGTAAHVNGLAFARREADGAIVELTAR